MLVVGLAMPFLLSGPIRAVSSLSLPVSLAMALTALGTALAILRPWTYPRISTFSSPRTWLLEGAALLPIGFAVWALYHRDFDGFMNLDGWDGANHVLLKDLFATTAPAAYDQQVSAYALAWWIEKILHVNSFRSFTTVFYLGVAGTVGVALMVAFAFINQEAGLRTRAFWLGILSAVIGTVAVLRWVILPLLHYNQAAGYYVHVFGLLVLALLWAADALIHTKSLRTVTLLLLLALLRYTYTLNLADAIFAIAVLLLLDSQHRRLNALLSLGMLAAGVLVVVKLRPIFHKWGGMQRFDVDMALTVNLVLIAGTAIFILTALLEQRPRAGLWRSPLLRAVRFPLLFAAFSSGLFSFFRTGAGIQYYYVTKYQVWACSLLAFASVLLLPAIGLSLLSPQNLRRPRVWIGLLIVSALTVIVPPRWKRAFIPYEAGLQERMGPHAPPYKQLRPLVDVEAIRRIEGVLATQNKQFGGFITTFIPMFSFMNAVFGRNADYQKFYPPVMPPNTCFFWTGKDNDTFKLGPVAVLDALRTTVATGGGSICATYPVLWKTTPQSLCYRCY
jgi:hypothetical protein